MRNVSMAAIEAGKRAFWRFTMTKNRALQHIRKIIPGASLAEREYMGARTVEVEFHDKTGRRLLRRYIDKNCDNPWAEGLQEVLTLQRDGKLS